jgi:hypothetical protein
LQAQVRRGEGQRWHEKVPRERQSRRSRNVSQLIPIPIFYFYPDSGLACM